MAETDEGSGGWGYRKSHEGETGEGQQEREAKERLDERNERETERGQAPQTGGAERGAAHVSTTHTTNTPGRPRAPGPEPFPARSAAQAPPKRAGEKDADEWDARGGTAAVREPAPAAPGAAVQPDWQSVGRADARDHGRGCPAVRLLSPGPPSGRHRTCSPRRATGVPVQLTVRLSITYGFELYREFRLQDRG